MAGFSSYAGNRELTGETANFAWHKCRTDAGRASSLKKNGEATLRKTNNNISPISEADSVRRFRNRLNR